MLNMEQASLYRPIPLATGFSNSCYLYNQPSFFVSTAGCDISIDAQVYLLYEMSIALLARRFNRTCEPDFNIDNFKLLVCSFLNLYQIYRYSNLFNYQNKRLFLKIFYILKLELILRNEDVENLGRVLFLNNTKNILIQNFVHKKI